MRAYPRWGGRGIAVGRHWRAVNLGDVGDGAGDRTSHVPDDVGDHKAKDTSNVVLWTLMPCLGFDILEPGLEVGSRMSEWLGDGNCRGLILRHGGWMDGWMDGCRILITTVDPNQVRD